MYDRIKGQPAVDATMVPVRPALPDVAIDEFIGGGHVAYPSGPLLLIAEGDGVGPKNAPHKWPRSGGFGLFGYYFRPPPPYLEIERIASSGPGPDPFFVPDPSQPGASLDTVGAIVGARFDLSDWTALKAEYRNTKSLDRDQVVQEGVLNWSWGF